jgi:hypothetical protein
LRKLLLELGEQMNYDHTITLIVPLDALDIAKAINRHLDHDDVGGFEGFSTRMTKDGIEYASYSRMCDSAYAQNAAMLVTVASELFDLCQADTRFEDKPTLEDCEAFCAVAEAYVDSSAEGYELVISVWNI